MVEIYFVVDNFLLTLMGIGLALVVFIYVVKGYKCSSGAFWSKRTSTAKTGKRTPKAMRSRTVNLRQRGSKSKTGANSTNQKDTKCSVSTISKTTSESDDNSSPIESPRKGKGKHVNFTESRNSIINDSESDSDT